MNLRARPERWMSRLSDAVMLLAAAGLIAMTGTVGVQVFARYVLNESPPWSESLALLLMLYFILLAAAIGVREGFHLRVRLLADRIPAKARRALQRGIDVVVGLFGACMAANGLYLAESTAEHLIPTLGISRAAAYWPFVISGALMCLFSFERVVRGRPSNDRGPPSNS